MKTSVCQLCLVYIGLKLGPEIPEELESPSPFHVEKMQKYFILLPICQSIFHSCVCSIFL